MEERPGKGQQQAKSLSLVSSQRVPYTAIRKAGGESVVGLKRDAEGWLGAPWGGVGPYLSSGGNGVVGG